MALGRGHQERAIRSLGFPGSALLRTDGEEGCDLLLDFLALALRAGNFSFFVICERHAQCERLFAFLAVIAVRWQRSTPIR